MAPPPRARQRLDSLTGLRFVAALLVFVYHAGLTLRYQHETGQGRVGVSFFFILSGYVLMWSRDQCVGAFQFYRRRVARIYPSYIVAWVGAATVVALILDAHISIRQFALGAVLLQAWIPKAGTNFAINGVSWSLSCEMFFYLTFPWWAAWLLNLRRFPRRTLAAVAALAIVAVAGISQHGLHGSHQQFFIWLVRTAPPVRFLEFFLGAWLAVEAKRGHNFDIGFWPAVALTVVGYAVCGLSEDAYTVTMVTFVPFMLLIAAASAADRREQSTWFARRWPVYLGEISYCFYLLHQVVMEACAHYLHPPKGVLIGIELIASVAVATALHEIVERPLERKIRGSNSVAVASVALTDIA